MKISFLMIVSFLLMIVSFLLIPLASAQETSNSFFTAEVIVLPNVQTSSNSNYTVIGGVNDFITGFTNNTIFNVLFGVLGLISEIDTVLPSLSNESLNKSFLNSSIENLNFSFIAIDISGIDSCWAELILENSSSSNVSGTMVSDRCDVISNIEQVGDFTFKSYANDTFGNIGNGSSLSGVRINATLGTLTLYNTSYITVNNIEYVNRSLIGNNTLGSLNATNVTLNYTGLTNWNCSGVLTSIDVENGSINTTEAYVCNKTPIIEISPTCPLDYTNYSTYCRKVRTDCSYETHDYFSQFNITTSDIDNFNIKYNIPTSRLKNWAYRTITTYNINDSSTNITLNNVGVMSIINNTLSEGIYDINIQYKIPRAQVPSEGPSVIYPEENITIIENITVIEEERIEIIDNRTVYEIYSDYINMLREQREEIIIPTINIYTIIYGCIIIFILIIIYLNYRYYTKKIKKIEKKQITL